ncbi:hypothetical protein COCNU_scaffold019863G000020 [Cocos nucifera]|nr:hypothetical protein [Cocos nucifera]
MQVSVHFVGIFSDCGADRNIHELPGQSQQFWNVEECFAMRSIKVSNSALISAFMTELEPDSPVTQRDYDSLKLSTAPYMERNLEFLIECMEDLNSQQNKFQYYHRNLSRQQAQQQAWHQKRRTENIARKAAGEEPLPEEDPSNPIFKPIPEPSCLDGYLITNQIANYCNQINGSVFLFSSATPQI